MSTNNIQSKIINMGHIFTAEKSKRKPQKKTSVRRLLTEVKAKNEIEFSYFYFEGPGVSIMSMTNNMIVLMHNTLNNLPDQYHTVSNPLR